MEKICMVYITVKDKHEAEKIANGLIREKLAACANVIENIQSYYIWEGKECREDEVLVILKSRENKLTEIEEMVKKMHSYDCPCIMAYSAIYTSRDFAEWVISSTS